MHVLAAFVDYYLGVSHALNIGECTQMLTLEKSDLTDQVGSEVQLLSEETCQRAYVSMSLDIEINCFFKADMNCRVDFGDSRRFRLVRISDVLKLDLQGAQGLIVINAGCGCLGSLFMGSQIDGWVHAARN